VYRLFTKQWSVCLPVIRKKFVPLVAKDFISVQPMNLPSGLVFHLDFKYCKKMFDLYEELWLEDFKDGELWCPQINDDCFVDDHTFREMRRKELIFEDWEIEQIMKLNC
jgi:hypothetical protein